MCDVLLVSADLFLGSRVRGAAEVAGRSLEVASSGRSAVERVADGRFRLVLIDLETPGLDLEAIMDGREARLTTYVAYGPHVRTGLLDGARRAGCDVVLTRGQLDASLGNLMAGLTDRGDDA